MKRSPLLAAFAALLLGAGPASAQYIGTFDCSVSPWITNNGDWGTASVDWEQRGPGSDEGALVATLLEGGWIFIRNQNPAVNGTIHNRLSLRATVTGLAPATSADLHVAAWQPGPDLVLYDVFPAALVAGENTLDLPLGAGFSQPEIVLLELRVIDGAGGPFVPGLEVAFDFIAVTDQVGFTPATQDTEACPGPFVDTFDCSTYGWVVDGTGASITHGRSEAPENGGRMEVRANGAGTQVFVRNIVTNVDGTVDNQFAMRVQAPFLSPGEQLPLTAVAYAPGPTLAYFDNLLPPITGPDPQIIRHPFGGGFLQDIAWLDLRFGGDANPVPLDGVILVDWVAVVADPLFEPAAQDTADCGGGIFYTFDCDLDGWLPNPNLAAAYANRDGGKAILTFPPSPANSQFNPPGVPFSVNVDETPWLVVSQKVTGTGAPQSPVGMLINTADQGFHDYLDAWSESNPVVQLNLASAFSGVVQITEVRFVQSGGFGINWPETELEIDWIAFAASPSAFPAGQDLEPCVEPPLAGWPMQAVRIPNGVTPPVLDGVISPGEWAPTGLPVPHVISLSTLAAADPYFPEFTHGGTLLGSVSSDDDLSATVHFVWDSNALYVAAEVTDDLLLPAAFPNVNNGDAFQLAIDYDRNGFSNAALPGAAVFIPSWAAAANVNDPARFQQFWPGSSPNPFTGTTWAVTTSATGYVLEARIPWSALTAGGDFFANPLPPVVGQAASVLVVLPDSDVNAGAVDGFLVTSGSGTNVILDSSRYHELRFVATPTGPSSVDSWTELLF